ncbi:MAG: bifunctional metallophosphatase/5'-nucleotidase [Chloroherpetonaceae bacterium]|nr:bifunctional metallophosphatase/5'-nucleotidase [Chloroherpetonaceae bacterium]MDW8438209.1 bifunctional UDP-sugar hydrolase/5'-nucleotidase [Chloroherpetonaceae bacterium]
MLTRLLSFLVVLSLSLHSGCGSSSAVRKDVSSRCKTLKIIHWNDFHAQNETRVLRKDGKSYRVGGAAVLKAYIDSLRNLAPNHSILLYAGDDFQGTPISSLTKGRSQILLMNQIKPDAVVPGNHEFDYGKENFAALLTEANYDVVCANLVVAKTGEPLFPPYKVIERGGLKIVVIGLITTDLPVLTIPENVAGLETKDYGVVLSKYLPEIKAKEKPDAIIVLSHIGLLNKLDYIDDLTLSRIYPEIAAFIGGHSHTPIFEPIRKGGGVIAQAGSRGQYVGELDLVIDPVGDSLVSFSGKLIETFADSVAPDSRVQAMVDSMEAPIKKMMDEEIGALKADWKSRFNESTNIGTWQTDVMREELKVDIAIQNSGGIRKSLNAGPIRVRDIWEISPFGNSFVLFGVTGKELRSMLEWQIDGRGEFCDMSGVVCKYNGALPYGKRIKEITVGGKPLEEEKVYVVATNNYAAAQLNALFGLQREVKVKGTPYIDHDFFVEAVRKRKVVSGEKREWLINVAKDK